MVRFGNVGKYGIYLQGTLPYIIPEVNSVKSGTGM